MVDALRRHARLHHAIPMSYDIGLTTLSLVVAIFVTGSGFLRHWSPERIDASPVLSGIFMGLGIAAMHYTGMAAMRGHAELSYDPLFVTLSLVIAIGRRRRWHYGWHSEPRTLGKSLLPRSSWAWPFPVCTTRQ